MQKANILNRLKHSFKYYGAVDGNASPIPQHASLPQHPHPPHESQTDCTLHWKTLQKWLERGMISSSLEDNVKMNTVFTAVLSH